jgi:hypothetical protein
VNALQKTLAIFAFLFLATQSVRIGYMLWGEPKQSVMDRYGHRPMDNGIAQTATLEELVSRYDVVHKEAEKLRVDLKKADQPLITDLESEPFKSESALSGAIIQWETDVKEVRELRFYWFAGLGFLIIGAVVYAKWNQWLGLTLCIAAFTEFIYWTYVDSFSLSVSLMNVRQHDRVLANKLVFTIASIVLLLGVIQMQGIFKKKADAYGLA